MIHKPALMRALKSCTVSWQMMGDAFYLSNSFGLWRVPDPALAEHLKIDAKPLPDGTLERLLDNHSGGGRAEPTSILIDGPDGITGRVYLTESYPIMVNVDLLAPVCWHGKAHLLPTDMTWEYSTNLLIGRQAGMVEIAVMELARGGSVFFARETLAAAIGAPA